MFIGYIQVAKGYKLYNLQTKKVIVSRDLSFDEQAVWEWSFNEKWPSSIYIHLEEQGEDQSTQPTSAQIMTPCSIASPRHLQRLYVLLAHLQHSIVDDDSNPTNEELIIFSLFTYCDLLSYKEVAQDGYWLKAMDKEIHTIEKNNT